MKLEITALSDLGLVREINEDNYRIVANRGLAVVCDGMGGHAAGEVASKLAVDTIGDIIASPEKGEPVPEKLQINKEFDPEARILVHAIRLANRRIFTQARKDTSKRGMGTTVVAAKFIDQSVVVCHVGDSRVYRFRNGNLEQLTVDHSWVNELISSNQLTEEESKTFVSKNVITRALGTRENVKVDVRQDKVAKGDIYLLCSDGLCGFVSDNDILASLSNTGASLEKIAKELIERANAAGGEDNITVALARVLDVEDDENLSRELINETVNEETRGESRLEDEILARAFALKKESEQHESTEAKTGPVPVYVQEKKRKGGRGWYFLAFLIVLIILGYLAYSYDIGGIKPKVDNLIGRVNGSQHAEESAVSQTQTGGMVFVRFVDFPDSLLNHTLYIDMIPQGTLYQYKSNQVGLESGYHILELRDDDGMVCARMSRSFAEDDTLLYPDHFNFTE